MLVKAFTEQILPHFSTGNPQSLLPVLDGVYPINEIQEAHAYMETNKNVGKIVLELPQWRRRGSTGQGYLRSSKSKLGENSQYSGDRVLHQARL